VELPLFFRIKAFKRAKPQAVRELGAPPEMVGLCDLLYAPNPLRTTAFAVAKEILLFEFFSLYLVTFEPIALTKEEEKEITEAASSLRAEPLTLRFEP
jgi:hypothetical protein